MLHGGKAIGKRNLNQVKEVRTRMLYTQGVLKIYQPQWAGKSLSLYQRLAFESGYRALVFNGVIWVHDGTGWQETVFRLSDFSDSNL
jgi:hypothetical protein